MACCWDSNVKWLLGGLLIAPHAVNADTTTPTVAKTVDQQDTLATQDTATIPVSSQTGSQTTSTDASASIEASTSTSVSISQSASESALVSESASQSGSTTESESSSTQSSTSSSTSTATSTSATSASSVAVKAATTADTTQTLGTQLGLGAKDTASVKDGQLTINVTDDASLTAPVLANIARYVSANAVNTTVILTAGAQITSRDGKVSVLILNGATAVSSIQDGKNLASAIGQVTGKVPTVEGIAATAAVSEAMAGYTTKSGAGLSILGVQISTGWDQEPSSQNVAIGQNAILIGTVSTAISEAFGQALTNAATSAISLGTISFKPTYKLYSSTGGSWTDTGLTSSTGVFSVPENTSGKIAYQIVYTYEATGTNAIASVLAGWVNVAVKGSMLLSSLGFNDGTYGSDVAVVTVDKPIAATGITVTAPIDYLLVGGKNGVTIPGSTPTDTSAGEQIEYTLNPTNSNDKITWSVDGGATISSTGYLTVTQPGTYTVTATATNAETGAVDARGSVEVTAGGGLSDQKVTAGDNVSIPLQGTGSLAGASVTYQWYNADGTAVSGATGTTLTINNVPASYDQHQYYVKMTVKTQDANGNTVTTVMQSNTMTLTVTDNTPKIEGGTETIYVGACGRFSGLSTSGTLL